MTATNGSESKIIKGEKKRKMISRDGDKIYAGCMCILLYVVRESQSLFEFLFDARFAFGRDLYEPETQTNPKESGRIS